MSRRNLPQRKRVKHFDNPEHARLLTFSCYQGRDLLVGEGLCCLLSDAIDRAVAAHGYGLSGFVYMPNHVHLLVWPRALEATVSPLLAAVKGPFSRRAKQRLTATDPRLVERLTVQERPGKLAFRFWQAGPGHDRNLLSDASVEQGLNYVHDNPVQAGLVRAPGEWQWSSWHFYHVEPEAWPKGLPTVHGLP